MEHPEITGVVLAGGQGRRLGGVDKGWYHFQGRPLIEHVVTRLETQVPRLMINANRSLEAYRALGFAVIEDRRPGFAGPLMGIWSALCAADTPWVVVVPCDTPCLPGDLVTRLHQGIGGKAIAVAHDGTRAHPVIALIRRDLADDLAIALAAGERKVARWYARHPCRYVNFAEGPAAFANLNTPQDGAALAPDATQ
ncbi:molybdenum cofactor guanylyltransferase MobA [Modicisalibacter coralii]|uniref:molybdenum cofactor guanylyltransferase MobA n=1 Tax=Modicisalibacter coralii TaxID=2304602 RepID=UPI00100AE3AE|nr:molybdenum cofactor guanylyltransferase MobA [Halomonas coralii]